FMSRLRYPLSWASRKPVLGLGAATQFQFDRHLAKHLPVIPRTRTEASLGPCDQLRQPEFGREWLTRRSQSLVEQVGRCRQAVRGMSEQLVGHLRNRHRADQRVKNFGTGDVLLHGASYDAASLLGGGIIIFVIQGQMKFV